MKTYGEERSFLESCGVRVVELSDESGRARVCLVPAWQGLWTAIGAGRVLLYMLAWIIVPLALRTLLQK